MLQELPGKYVSEDYQDQNRDDDDRFRIPCPPFKSSGHDRYSSLGAPRAQAERNGASGALRRRSGRREHSRTTKSERVE